MRALEPRVVDAVWAAIAALLPPPPVDEHPLGCHRARIDDKTCFTGILIRLVVGCSWVDAGRLVGVGQATLRRRRDEWIEAQVFDLLADEAIAAYDRVHELDLSEVLIDGSQHKAPGGGEGTGKNPTDRAKLGFKWSIATDRTGVPIAWATDGANRHDIVLLAPTLAGVIDRGLHHDIETVHLDRGYDTHTVRATLAEHHLAETVIAKRRKPGEPKTPGRPLRLGLRWAVERTNSWLSNYGQLRRNTDRRTIHRLAQLALAITLTITAKLIDWHDRWNT